MSKYKGSVSSKHEVQQAAELLKETKRLVGLARYRDAFLLAKSALKQHPDNRFVQFRYAVLLGDSEEMTSAKRHASNTKQAAALLKKLLRRASGIDPIWVSIWKNEYYWFSKQPLKQWKLGVRNVEAGNKSGYYSMGVGAVCLAVKHFEKNQSKLALKWAEKAELAWRKYIEHLPTYYNGYVWYAKSLGLQLKMIEMEESLREAAKLAQKPIDYKEFSDARTLVAEATRNRR